MDSPTRLNKYLAHTLGISRREADLYIQQGRAVVNGHTAILGAVVTPGRDKVSINNKPIDVVHKRSTYVLMNKPVGYVCSRKQQGTNPTIYDLLPRHYHHLKVAGRLDKDSQGLVLLTDDGDLIFSLTHPKFAKEKVYHVGLNKPLGPADIKKISAGVQLEDGVSKFQVSSLKKQGSLSSSKTPDQVRRDKLPNLYMVTMHEGRNRQIRRTFKALDYTVTYLERIHFGPYHLSQLSDKLYLQI